MKREEVRNFRVEIRRSEAPILTSTGLGMSGGQCSRLELGSYSRIHSPSSRGVFDEAISRLTEKASDRMSPFGGSASYFDGAQHERRVASVENSITLFDSAFGIPLTPNPSPDVLHRAKQLYGGRGEPENHDAPFLGLKPRGNTKAFNTRPSGGNSIPLFNSAFF